MTRTAFRLNRALSATAAAALFAALAVPAQAANTNAANSGRSDATNARAPAQADRQAGNRRICVRADFTGSRVAKTVCKTEREWEAAGGIPTAED